MAERSRDGERKEIGEKQMKTEILSRYNNDE